MTATRGADVRYAAIRLVTSCSKLQTELRCTALYCTQGKHESGTHGQPLAEMTYMEALIAGITQGERF